MSRVRAEQLLRHQVSIHQNKRLLGYALCVCVTRRQIITCLQAICEQSTAESGVRLSQMPATLRGVRHIGDINVSLEWKHGRHTVRCLLFYGNILLLMEDSSLRGISTSSTPNVKDAQC